VINADKVVPVSYACARRARRSERDDPHEGARESPSVIDAATSLDDAQTHHERWSAKDTAERGNGPALHTVDVEGAAGILIGPW